MPRYVKDIRTMPPNFVPWEYVGTPRRDSWRPIILIFLGIWAVCLSSVLAVVAVINLTTQQPQTVQSSQITPVIEFTPEITPLADETQALDVTSETTPETIPLADDTTPEITIEATSSPAPPTPIRIVEREIVVITTTPLPTYTLYPTYTPAPNLRETIVLTSPPEREIVIQTVPPIRDVIIQTVPPIINTVIVIPSLTPSFTPTFTQTPTITPTLTMTPTFTPSPTMTMETTPEITAMP